MDTFSKTWFKNALDSVDMQPVAVAVSAITYALKNGHNVYLAGNGGSLNIAEHMASDLAKGIGSVTGHSLQVHCLASNQAMFSAIANDLEYAEVFAHQLRAAQVALGDVFVAFSVSGTSGNILRSLGVLEGQTPPVDSVLFLGNRTGMQWHPRPHTAVIAVTTPMSLEKADHFAVVEGVFSCLAHMIARMVANKLNEGDEDGLN